MDKLTDQQRSKVMASVRSSGTKLEQYFVQKLEAKGINNLILNSVELTGKPDIVIFDKKIVIFIDSCFWHGCKKHLRMPASRLDYWEKKIRRNKARDKEVTSSLINEGWIVLRIWEHSLKNSRTLRWWITRICNLVK